MRYLFVSVDPERDTPEQLKLYLSNFDPRITGLVGTPAEIAAVAKAYRAIYEKVPTKNGFTYNHTAEVYPDGQRRPPRRHASTTRSRRTCSSRSCGG